MTKFSNISKKIIVFSSDYNYEDGQAVVTRRVLRSVLPKVGENLYCIYPKGFSVKSILSWFVVCCNLWWYLCLHRIGSVYIVCSRTTPGFIRDLPALLMTFFNVRVIVHCHGSDFEELLTRRWFSSIVQLIYRRCEVIVPCRNLRRRIKDKVGKVHICENFFGETYFSAEKSTQNLSYFSVTWNSNIMSSKGFFDVLSAVDSLVNAGYNIELLCYGRIIGDYEMSEKTVRQKLSKYKDFSWFSFLGAITHSQAVHLLHNADVVILPSRYKSEMQPLSIIEAMCASKCIIVSDRPSLRATVANYPADFVPIKDVNAITKCIKRLYNERLFNPKLFSKKNSVQASLSKKRFSLERFDKEMRNLLTFE